MFFNQRTSACKIFSWSFMLHYLTLMRFPKRRWHDLLICIKSIILQDTKSDSSSRLQVQSSYSISQVFLTNYCQAELLCQIYLLTAYDTFINLNWIIVGNHKFHALLCVRFLGWKRKFSSSFRQCNDWIKHLLTCQID